MRRWLYGLALLLACTATANWNANQALQPFRNNWVKIAGGGSLPTPDFQANLTSTLTPEIGGSATFARATPRMYWNSPTTLETLSDDDSAIPAYQTDLDSSAGGYGMWGPSKNWALQSDAPGTTWTAVGAPTIANGAATFFGTVAAGSIAGVVGEGITQTVGFSAVSKTVMLSFFAQAVTSPVTVRLTIEGSSGGAPQQLNQDVIVAPNEPSRYYRWKTFTGAATGDVKVSITLRTNGTIHVGGIMVEDIATDGETDRITGTPGPLIQTTVAAVSHGADILQYPADNFSNTSKFSFSIWANSDWRLFQSSQAYSDLAPISNTGDKYLLRVRDAGNQSVIEFTSSSGQAEMKVFVNGTDFSALFEGNYARRWYHFVVSVDYAADIYKLYRNGVLVATHTTAAAAPGAATSFYIGHPGGYRQWQGIVNYIKYYAGSKMLTDSQVAALYQSELAVHQEGTYKDGWPLGPNWQNPYTQFFLDFSEASGTITDEVGANALTVTGSPTFNVASSGRFAALTPGITYTTSAAHRKLTAVSSLNMDTSTDHMIIQAYVHKTSTSGEQNIVTLLGHGSTSDYMARLFFSDDTTLNLALQADDGAAFSESWTLPASITDGSLHKIKVRWGAHTAATLWVDNRQHQTTHAGDEVGVSTCLGIRVAEKYDGSGDNFIGTMTSLSIAKATSDSSSIMIDNGGPMSSGSD